MASGQVPFRCQLAQTIKDIAHAGLPDRVTIGLVEGKSGLSKYSTPFGRRAIKEYTSDPK